MDVDYIIVGCGLASIAFCEQLRSHQKTFVVFDNASQQSSLVAAGLYNPVTLKRFTEVWEADAQLTLAMPYYGRLEQLLNVKLDYKVRILRRFASIEEQNLWYSATDKPLLEPYLSPEIIKTNFDGIDSPFGFGEVFQAGRVDTAILISAYKKYLREQQCLFDESLHYRELKSNNQTINYKHIISKNIVFAEGFGVKNNPYFKDLPLNGTKGEIMEVYAPNLNLEVAVKSSVFLIPLGNHHYNVGATYNWNDKTNQTTQAAKEDLSKKLKQFLKAPFEVVEQKAGIRPTTKDRRPLVGRHSTYQNMFVLNGLGTRGVMISPYVADALYKYIEANQPLPNEIDINRFLVGQD
ncbi:NAD(P)/FAD-dependent oxidoreductase [Paucihalobacter sp.]|uniref:NAD(P)/FAD-dependent oxidoreductase n=1 Tax=Paucihalobacter sp. TaxID=2850405 RepID=UPI002FE1523D